MTRNDDVLDRLAPLSGAPSRDFEDLLRLRDKRQRARKIGAFAVVAALVAVLVGVGLGAIGDRSGKPVNTPDESRAPAFTGLVVEATGNDCNDHPGDLVAEDPRTGETITLVDIATVVRIAGFHRVGERVRRRQMVRVRGQALRCDRTDRGLWVTNGSDEPRQLTTTLLRLGSVRLLGMVAHRFAARDRRGRPPGPHRSGDRRSNGSRASGW